MNYKIEHRVPVNCHHFTPVTVRLQDMILVRPQKNSPRTRKLTQVIMDRILKLSRVLGEVKGKFSAFSAEEFMYV